MVVCFSTLTAHSLPRAGDAGGEGLPGEVLLREHRVEGEEGEAHANAHVLLRMAQEPTTWSQAAVPGPEIAGWLDVFRVESRAGRRSSTLPNILVRAHPQVGLLTSCLARIYSSSESQGRQGVCASLHRGLR